MKPGLFPVYCTMTKAQTLKNRTCLKNTALDTAVAKSRAGTTYLNSICLLS